MDTFKRISELDDSELDLIERLFKQRLSESSDGILILRTTEPTSCVIEENCVPDWCNVLEGLSDQDLAEFCAELHAPVRLAHPAV